MATTMVLKTIPAHLDESETADKTGRIDSSLSAPSPLPISEVMRVHGHTLQRRALWLTKNEFDAADLFQEMLARALRRPQPDLTAETALRWLSRIMYNAFCDICRARAVRCAVPFDSLLENRLTIDEAADRPPWRDLDDETVRASIKRLPRQMRFMLELQLSGMSYAEMAQLLEIPMGTAGSRLMRARERLRTLLVAATEEHFASPMSE
jgi:RNA polymerase sigma-70 factor (ECF subfamily)